MKGSLKEGKGSVTTESSVLAHAQYSFGTRFESGIGTNPEDLVAAAHAACFSMQLSALLGKAGLVPEQIATTAVVTIENREQGWTVTYRMAANSKSRCSTALSDGPWEPSWGWQLPTLKDELSGSSATDPSR